VVTALSTQRNSSRSGISQLGVVTDHFATEISTPDCIQISVCYLDNFQIEQSVTAKSEYNFKINNFSIDYSNIPSSKLSNKHKNNPNGVQM
jgi:hypothetical protein